MKIALASCTDLPGWEIDDAPLIESLQSKGVDVHQPAWTEDINWEQFDATIIRTTWDYHLNIDAFLGWANRVPRLFNNAAIVRWNSSKSYLKELETKGAVIAPTVWIPKNAECSIEEIMDHFDTSYGFIKPQIGACASDTFRFDRENYDNAQSFLNERTSMDMMVQPYIESVETVGELTAMYIAGTFSHGVQKIPVKGDYRVQDDFGAKDMPYTFTQDEIKLMDELLTLVPNYDSLLYARFDFLKSHNGSMLLNELELIEPSMFFRHCSQSPQLFADAIINAVKNSL